MKYRECDGIAFPSLLITFLQMEPGVSYNCAFDWIISFYETDHLFSTSVVRYESPPDTPLFSTYL